ncbi:MAG: tetratricopeptide repeat protein [Paludisphaera borealis]|uniref:tetratricopeptide repeat protein n=1 Tax=Paludisphaera borealis TaxID=1387353 RepID=UPI0028431129|nr:tetratricopeptide repeat protein [Paludisphaera borealis]MDR3621875.1 tetratricopeptide repeat protein [Paludisphaera borealis]
MSKSSESPPVTAGRPPTAKAPRSHVTSWLVGTLIGFTVVAIVVVLVSLSRSNDPDQLWVSAEAALREGRFNDAAAAVNLLSRARDPLPRDWMLRAQVAVARKNVDEAIEDLGQIPDDDRIASQAWLLKGQVELRRNRAKNAELALRKALTLDPTLTQAHRELIFIYGMQLRRNELNEEFKALSELTELTYDNVFHWCLVRNCIWEPGEVAQTLAEFLAADPTDRQTRLSLADNYRRLGLFDEADQALAELPQDDPEALAGRVMLAMDRRQEELAEELLAKGPADDPNLARIRGRIALARRNGPDAVHNFQIAYDHEPGDRDTLFGLINAHELCGDDAAALPLRQAAKNLEIFNTLMQRVSAPGGRKDASLMKEMGAACSSLGFIPEARSWYKLAIARDPLDAVSQQALFRLNAKARVNDPPADHPIPPDAPHNP